MTNDVIVRPQSPFQEKYLKSNAKILVVGGAAGCLPAETEFLTEDGWKNISDWSGEKIAEVTLDKKDRNFASLEFVEPKEYVKLPCDKMSKLTSTRFSMTLSDEHNVVYWNQGREAFCELNFSEVLDRHKLSANSGWKGQIKTCFSSVEGKSGTGLSEGDLRLQIIAMADGSFPKSRKDTYCKLGISKKRKIDRFLELAEKFGWDYEDKGWQTNERYTRGGFHSFIIRPKLRQKRYTGVFWDATQDELDIIHNEVGHWDGTRSIRGESNPVLRFFSKHKEDADFIQYVFSSQGKTSSISYAPRDGFPLYTVNSTTQNYRSFANKDGKCPVETVKTSDGFKYCFTTSSGYFLVRQDGNIFVTGNSSKSYVGLMRHLRWAHDPKYNGYCIRQHSNDLMKAGGLFQEAIGLYEQVYPDIKVKIKDQMIVFPSGASVSFSHYENDAAGKKYQGLQLSNVFYDEATHADEKHIWWLLSRLRTSANMTPGIWLSCNPDPDSYLFEWVKWWLYPEGHPQHGIADPDKNGITRYVLRRGSDMYWGDTPEELIVRYGKPELPLDHKKQVKPIAFQVLLGTLDR